MKQATILIFTISIRNNGMDEEPKKSINIDYYIEMLLKRR